MKRVLVLGLHCEWMIWLDEMKASNPIHNHKMRLSQFITEDAAYFHTSTAGGDTAVIDRLRGTEFHDVIYLHSSHKLRTTTIHYVESRMRLKNQ